MILLAQNNTGLKNLIKLSSEAYRSGLFYKPRIDDALLGDLSEGLIATSACLGSYSSQLILSGDVLGAERLLDHHAALFPDRFFIELQLHTGPEQTLVNKVLMDIAHRKNLPMIVTNDSHYTRQEDKPLHEASLCMQTSSVMSDPPYNHEHKEANIGVKTRFSFGDIDVHMAHHDWMWARAQELGIPYEAISNTLHVAEMIDDQTYFQERKNRYTQYQKGQNPIPSWEILCKEVYARLPERLGHNPSQEYIDRINHELLIIKKMGYYDYMLIVQELVAEAKTAGVLCGPGRGCFVPGSQVKLSNNEFKNIEDIAIGDIVISHDNTSNTVYNTLIYQVDEELIELELENGLKIRCTKDHKIHTQNRGWVQAQHLGFEDDITEID